MEIKILSFNCHKFRSPFKRRYNIESLRQTFSTLDVDIILLQELRGIHPQKNSETFNGQEPLEFLADSLWSNYAYGKNSVYPKGHHGNAILSKYPIVDFHNYDISCQRWQDRGLLHGKIEVPGKTNFSVYTTHLDLNQKGRNTQMTQIQKVLLEAQEPYILGGDFNDWNHQIHKQLGHQQPKLATYPSFFPFLSLDAVYASGFEISEIKCLKDKAWRGLSDHLPLLAKAKLNHER